MDSRAAAILKTLLYFDIFDYPLKKEEIYKFSGDDNFEKKELSKILLSLKKQIKTKDGYFYLTNRKEIVNLRKEREKISALKFKKAKMIIKKLIFIPSVKFIGISGALSMNNAHAGDDIDIFIISERNLVWTTRFLVILILKLQGVYRSKNDKSYSDKICLNMIVAEDKLNFEKANKNLYTAHEIVQLVPIFDRNKTYREFISLNSWIKTFLPNTQDDKKVIFSKDKTISNKFWIFVFNTLRIEKIFQFIQFNYMKRGISKEIVKEGFLGFHPFDYKSFVLNNYIKKLNEYNLRKTRT